MEIHTPPKKDGIEFDYICKNPVIHNVLRMMRMGEITETEGMYMMINALAGAYEILMQSNVELTKRLSSEGVPAVLRGGD